MSSILRKRLTRGWTGIQNSTIRDTAISFRATGLLAFLLSMDDGWSMDGKIISERKAQEGRDAVRAAMKELRGAGYVRHVKMREHGRFVTEVEVSDVPVAEWTGGALLDLTKDGISGPGEPGAGEPGSGAPGSGEPVAGGSGDLGENPSEEPRSTPEDPRPPSPTAPTVTQRAQAIVREWWDARKANGSPSAQSFIAVQRVVETAIRNGVGDDDLRWALTQCPTVSGGSIEMALSRRRPTGRPGVLAQMSELRFEDGALVE